MVELFEAYRAFYGAPPHRERSETFLSARLAIGDSVLIVGVDNNDVPIAFAQLLPSQSSLQLAPRWLLADLFVSPQHRGRGVGHAILATARAVAARRGATSMELFTAHDNAVARRLYESSGYVLDTSFVHYETEISSDDEPPPPRGHTS